MLKEYGCYFLCALQWAETETDREEFTERQIQYIYETALEKGFIRKDCTMLFPHDVLNLAMLENKYTATRIVKAAPPKDRYVVYLTKPGYGHFVLSDGGEIWDPLEPRRAGAKGYAVDSYREIT